MAKKRRPTLPQLTLPPQLTSRMGFHLVRAALLLLIGYFLVNFIGLVLDDHRIKAQIAEMEAQNAQLRNENVALEGELAYTLSDAYVEQTAREQLGMARDGETVLVPQIVATTPTPGPAATPSAPPPPQRSNLERWLGALSGNF